MSVRDLGIISVQRSADSCESWVGSWREHGPGGSRRLEGHLLKSLDKGLGEVRERVRLEKEKKEILGTSLVAQWIRLCAPNAGGPGLIPGLGTGSHMHAAPKSLHATTKEPVCRK